MPHEEIEGAFLPFQKDAGQIYAGWKEELTHTCCHRRHHGCRKEDPLRGFRGDPHRTA
jgi:hypothetical protein